MPVNLVLFDEIEKANDALFQLLLGILDHGKITLGNGKEVKFDQSVIMTSNLGAGQGGLLSGETRSLRPERPKTPHAPARASRRPPDHRRRRSESAARHPP
jgi:ATP-dependent Clp protease ATP-binding subunit ClpB